MRAAAPVAILVLVGLGIALLVVNLATGAHVPDYAHLVPAPDSIVWEEGDETVLWLETNRVDVDLVVDSVSLGFGDVHRLFPESGESLRLGRAEGCVPYAVAELRVSSIYDNQVGVTKFVEYEGEVDRNGYTGTATVYVRAYSSDGTSGASLGATNGIITINVPSGSTRFVGDTGLTRWSVPAGETVTVEASHSDRFPDPYTRADEADVSMPPDAVGDEGPEAVVLHENSGLGVIACSERDDVEILLRGDDGTELNRYVVDIHPAPGVAPRSAAYATRRVCVDADDLQTNYLDGGEEVGETFDETDFYGSNATSTIQTVEVAGDFRFFFRASVSGGDVQITVSDVGARRFGLDADQIYPIRLTATDDSSPPETASLDVGVWVDADTLSPNDDGLCT